MTKSTIRRLPPFVILEVRKLEDTLEFMIGLVDTKNHALLDCKRFGGIAEHKDLQVAVNDFRDELIACGVF